MGSPRVLVHLVNYDPTTTLTNIPIKLRLAGPGPNFARVFSPERTGSHRLTLRNEGNLCACTLPELKVYAVIAIKGAKL